MQKVLLTEMEMKFIRDAVQDKYESIMEKLVFQENEEQEKPVNTFTVNAIQAEALKRAGVWKTKKPHWTQTPEGKKIMAKRRTRGSKK